MKLSRKSKRVSWASGVNLSQVKMFSTEDCPTEVGQKFQNHLQAKVSRMFHSSSTEVQDLPPGFEHSLCSSQPELRLPQIPQVQWKCPPKFVLCSTLHVATGEESEEKKFQSSRNARMLEAHYPRFSAIPPSPSVSFHIENEHYDDSRTPIVPLIPIEEVDGASIPNDIEPEVNSIKSESAALLQVLLPSGTSTISKNNSSALELLSNSQHAIGKLANSGADVTAAAATIAVIMASNEKESFIDTDLLIKILSDPKMIQNLKTDGPIISSRSASTSSFCQVLEPVASMAPVANPPMLEVQKPVGGNLSHVLDRFSKNSTRIPFQSEAGLNQEAPSVPISLPESNPTLVILSRPTTGNLFPVPNKVRSNENITSASKNIDVVSSPMVKQALPLKDMNYYKNLVRQHGEEKKVIQNETLNNNHFQDVKMVQNSKTGELNPKNSKPCIYFKSLKGCRNGVSCPFQHDVSIQWKSGSMLEVHGAKRIKLSGRTY